jgi:hypothetical protein
MRRLTASLAAAAAVASLTLIPLAAAGSASAAVTASSPGKPEMNWAGYEDDVTHPTQLSKYGGNQMAEIYATFTVPAINCSKSVIGPREWSASYRKAHGNYWSVVSFWAGLDGEQGSNSIEQAGIDGICHSQYGTAVYEPMWQTDVAPNSAQTGGYPTLETAGGKSVAVQAGDVITASVYDNMPFTTNLKTGYAYGLNIKDVTRNASWSEVEKTPARAPDAQAEVITEAVNNGPYAPATLNGKPFEPSGTVGLAAFSPVTYTVQVSSYEIGYVYGLSMAADAPYWTLTKKYVKGDGQTLIATGLIKNVDQTTTFTNTFR